jgi:hypothetical protein
MGAFGTKNFQNDPAMDFKEEFVTNPSLETVENALLLNDYEEGEEYLEVDEACAALAAAEIVAAILGKPSADFPSNLQKTIHPISSNTKLQKLARKIVKQIAKESELQKLWAEGDKLDEWLAVQKDLLNRLK